MIKSDSWIFINYVPGAFGSFLTKVLELSPEVAGTKTTNIFDQYNASHQNINRWINGIHDGDEINQWVNLTFAEQEKFLIDNIFSHTLQTDKRKICRITVPKYNSIFRKHFTQARFVKITIDDDLIDLVTKNMTDKTFNYWVEHKLVRNPTVKQLLDRATDDEKKEYFRKECRKRIINTIDNSVEPNTFNLPVRAFLHKEVFRSTVNNLITWLELPPISYDHLYDEFYQRHNGFI